MIKYRSSSSIIARLPLHLPQRLLVSTKHITPPHPFIKSTIPHAPHPTLHLPSLLLSLFLLPQRTSLPLYRLSRRHPINHFILYGLSEGGELLFPCQRREGGEGATGLVRIEGGGMLGDEGCLGWVGGGGESGLPD